MLVLNCMMKNSFDRMKRNYKTEPITFEKRVELLKYEKKLVCEGYAQCEDAATDGRMYSNPKNALEKCRKTLSDLKTTEIPANFNTSAKIALKQAISIFITKTELNIKEANRVTEAQNKPAPLIYINLAPMFEPKSCDAYIYLDKLNEEYDIKKVMYDENEKYYHYVHCNNLSTDDLSKLLLNYDNKSTK